MDLAVEVLAAALESRVAVRHPSERRERLRSAAQARNACDQRCDVLHVQLCRRALGEVLAKDVVEPVACSFRGSPGTSGAVGVFPFDQLPGCGADVVGTPRVRGSKVLAQKRTRTARPEQETDAEADR